MLLEQNSFANLEQYSSAKIDALVAESQDLCQRIDQSFDNGLVLYGAGFVGKWALNYMQSLGANIPHFYDSDLNKAGCLIDGVPIKNPADGTAEISAMLVTARHAFAQIKAQFDSSNIPIMSFDGYFIVKNYERLRRVRDQFLQDDVSVMTFNAILWSLLNGSEQGCKDVLVKDMYFGLKDFSGNFNETFVDAGAFVGDSVERFIWENLGTFNHLYAFEPGEKQFKALQVRMKRLCAEWAIAEDKVSLIEAGLGKENGTANFAYLDDSPLRHALHNDEEAGDSGAKIYALDDYLNGKPVSLIKADVEGMEMDLLRGARATIVKHRPKLALCVYHYPADLYEIPEFIDSLGLNYRFDLRQHAPVIGDYVLYCY